MNIDELMSAILIMAFAIVIVAAVGLVITILDIKDEKNNNDIIRELVNERDRIFARNCDMIYKINIARDAVYGQMMDAYEKEDTKRYETIRKIYILMPEDEENAG